MNNALSRFVLICTFSLCTLFSYGQCVSGETGNTVGSEYTLIWSDEFSESGAVCSDNWFHQTQLPAGGNWYNNEQQHYTDELANSSVANGLLTITAIKENYTDQGFTKSYTSARLNSKFAFTYGRVDARAKLPSGNGTWPAIWMLGKDIIEPGGYWSEDYGTDAWPAIGEIDIMEHWGNNPNVIHGSLHTTSSSGATQNTGTTTIPNVSSEFHIYSMIWDEDKIQFLVDDVAYYTYQPENKTAATWPFDSPQYFLLNIAMGGIGGAIDPNFSSSSMEIDYIRVYQKDDNAAVATEPTIAAEDPSAASEDVISIYSDSYTDVAGTNMSPNWQQPTPVIVTDESIGNNNIKKYSPLSYQGIEFQSAIDVSGMDKLHMDVWTKDIASLDVYLISTGPVETEVSNAPGTGHWYAIDIDLADYSGIVDLTDVVQMKLVDTNGGGSLWIDNIYFYKEPTPVCSSGLSGNAVGSEYTLVWSDEFLTEGTVCSDNWHHQTKIPLPEGWFGGEKQHYTDRLDNSFVGGGNLTIKAKKETFVNQGVSKDYTSARLNSKFAFTYGRVDVRAQLPEGEGTWPAIWMLGRNISEDGGFWFNEYGDTSWPACGEIDIMEHWGDDQNKIHGSLHTPASNGGTVNTGTVIASDVSNSFHVYSMIWDRDKIRFLIDDVTYYTYQPLVKNVNNWPFDDPQYIVLNVAMGDYNRTIDPNFTESSMVIDYVRVYQKDSDTPDIAAIAPTLGSDKVTSLFSDTYNDETVDHWTTGWSSVGSHEDIFVDGNTIKKYSDLNSAAAEAVSSPIDISGMTHLHLDFWSPNSTEFKVKLVDFGANGVYDANGDDSEHELVISNPEQSRWVSYDLPLSDFTGLQGREHFAQLILASNPAGTSTIYLDNIYFKNDPEITLPIDFESTITSEDFIDFGGAASYVDPNAEINGINQSVKTGKTIRSAGEIYAGSTLILDEYIDFSTLKGFSMKVFTDAPVGTLIKFKLEGDQAMFKEVDQNTTVSSAWETIVWDFTGKPSGVFDKITLLFDYGNIGDGSDASSFLFDDIQQVEIAVPASPEVAAEAPTEPSGNVISLFSETYTDVNVDTWKTDWSVGSLEEITVDGSLVRKYSDMSFVGIETATNQLDITSMTHFHLDFWSENSNEFKVKLVDFGANGTFDNGGGDDTEHELIFSTPALETWVAYDINLDDFTSLTGRENLTQIVLSSSPANESTVFIDNVYFYEVQVPLTEPAAAAPIPDYDASDVISMFSEAYTSVAVDTWRTDWSVGIFSDVTIDGGLVKKYENVQFVGIETVNNQIDISGMTHLHLDFWSPNSTTFKVKLVDFGSNAVYQGEPNDDTEHELIFDNPAQGQWVSYDLALSDFTGLVNRENLSQLILSSVPHGSSTLLIDNIYFYNDFNGPNMTISEDFTSTEDITCNNLTIGANTTFTMSPGHTLTINGDMSGSGALVIKSGASLITYDGNPVGNVTIERNTRYADGRYSFVGSPVATDPNITGADLGTTVYSYNEAVAFGDDGLIRWEDATDDQLESGIGYAQAFQKELSFTGVPNHGNITVTGLSHSAFDGNHTQHGWSLLSNPYPAAIDASKFLAANAVTSGAIYLWDDHGSEAARGDNDDYLTVNSLGAVTGPNGGSFEGYIGSAQGFFVKIAAPSTDVSVVFNESMREIGRNSDATFFREQSTPVTIKIAIHNNDQSLYNELLVGFLEGATTGVDKGLDADKFSGSQALQFYSYIDDQKYAIQGLPLADEAQTDLGFDLSEQTQLSITTESIKNLPTGNSIVLTNKVTAQEYILEEGDTFSFSASKGDNQNRFNLRLVSKRVLSASSLANSPVFHIGDDQLIATFTKPTKIESYAIYDLAGKVLDKSSLSNVFTQELKIPINSKGVRIVRIETEDAVFTRKFVF